MKLLLATSNPHKLDEVRAVIDDPRVEWVTLADVDPDVDIPEPVEDAGTFEGNAAVKARAYAAATGLITVADDSGLAVDALGGAPGVRSARYAGHPGPRHLTDLANNAKLLAELKDVPRGQRTAHFVCAMVLVSAPRPEKGVGNLFQPGLEKVPDTFSVRGEVHGRIIEPHEADDPASPEHGRGDHGFGYDPLFALPDDHPAHPGRTTAELTPEQKNALSHRGVAARLLWEQLRQGFDLG